MYLPWCWLSGLALLLTVWWYTLLVEQIVAIAIVRSLSYRIVVVHSVVLFVAGHLSINFMGYHASIIRRVLRRKTSLH